MFPGLHQQADQGAAVTLQIPIPGGAVLVIEVDASQVEELIRGTLDRASDTDPLWQMIGDRMRSTFARRFRTAGDGRWAPLKARTLREKQRLGFPADPLIRTHELEESYVSQGARGHVEEVTDGGHGFVIGSDLTKSREVKPEKPVKPYHIVSAIQARKHRLRKGSIWARVPVAVIHHLGSQDGRIPARPVAEFDDQDARFIAEAGRNWLIGEEPSAASVHDDGAAG